MRYGKEGIYMKNTIKISIANILLIFAGIIISILIFSLNVQAASAPSYSYRAHVMDKGWLSAVSAGQTAGTTGEERRLEAFRIWVKNGDKSGVSYRAYCADEGWQRWVTANKDAGTIGKKRQVEAIQVKLTNGMENKYDVYYRAHCANYGWLGWAKNGETAGGSAKNIRIEAFQLKIVVKGSSFSRGGNASYVTKIPECIYRAHVMDKGWLSHVILGETAGTIGEERRMEAFRITLKNGSLSGVSYRAHCADIGWQGWKTSSQIAGTQGQKRQIEGIQIKLTNGLDNKYDIYYRAHCANYGWLGWAKNGELAGTTGKNTRMEAFQIEIVPKGEFFARGGIAGYIETKDDTTPGYAQPVKISNAKWSTKTEGNAGCQHDIQASGIHGKPVYAIQNGTIRCEQKYTWNGGKRFLLSYGNVIYFTSFDGKTKAVYAHLNSFSKTASAIPAYDTKQWSASKYKVYPLNLGSYTVKKGETIGYVGTTGNSTGSHLHLELNINGRRVNPPQYLKIN